MIFKFKENLSRSIFKIFEMISWSLEEDEGRLKKKTNFGWIICVIWFSDMKLYIVIQKKKHEFLMFLLKKKEIARFLRTTRNSTAARFRSQVAWESLTHCLWPNSLATTRATTTTGTPAWTPRFRILTRPRCS